jgi:hypothetical protein
MAGPVGLDIEAPAEWIVTAEEERQLIELFSPSPVENVPAPFSDEERRALDGLFDLAMAPPDETTPPFIADLDFALLFDDPNDSNWLIEYAIWRAQNNIMIEDSDDEDMDKENVPPPFCL